jgi:hypothetical protein
VVVKDYDRLSAPLVAAAVVGIVSETIFALHGFHDVPSVNTCISTTGELTCLIATY